MDFAINLQYVVFRMMDKYNMLYVDLTNMMRYDKIKLIKILHSPEKNDPAYEAG